MSYLYGNPNFSLNPLMKGPTFQLAGTTDYTKLFKDSPMFNGEFQMETGNNSGVPPETEATVAKTNDPAAVTDPYGLRGMYQDMIGMRERERREEPERMREMLGIYNQFEKERLAQGKPYALMEKIPDTISKGFDRQAQQIGLQAAMMGASSNDLANILGGTRIPQIAVPGGSAIQARQNYF